jgi:hypothetical protein
MASFYRRAIPPLTSCWSCRKGAPQASISNRDHLPHGEFTPTILDAVRSWFLDYDLIHIGRISRGADDPAV